MANRDQARRFPQGCAALRAKAAYLTAGSAASMKPECRFARTRAADGIHCGSGSLEGMPQRQAGAPD
jgi:hypothetical protein